MKTLLAPLQEINAYGSAKECIGRGRLPLHISGCMDSQKAHFIYGLSEGIFWKVIVAQNEIKARELMEEYRMFDRETLYFPSKDVIFYSADIHGNAITAERLKVVEALLTKSEGTVITTMDAGMEHLPSISTYKSSACKVKEGELLDLEQMSSHLTNMGYQRQNQVEAAGDFSVRGGILDLFPITADCPYRIELWGDEIDTIRSFDVESQRSIERMTELSIFPASEFIVTQAEIKEAFQNMKADKKKLLEQFRKEKNHEGMNRLNETIQVLEEEFEVYGSRMGLDGYLPYFAVPTGSLFDYFDREKTVFFIDDPQRCIEKMETVEAEFRESMAGRLEKGYILPKQMEILYSADTVNAILQNKRSVYLTMLDSLPKQIHAEASYNLQVQPTGSYNKHFELLADDIRKWRKDGFRVLLLSGSRTRAERLSKDLNEYDIPAFYRERLDIVLEAGQVMTSYGFLHKGFSYATAKFVVVTEGDIFGAKARARRHKQKQYSGKAIQSFNELNIGDYVVHENHGLGIYRGIEKIQVDRTTKDYIKIEYGDGGNLYVPASGMDVLQKFAGQDAKKPKLNKLNSNEWKKTKSRVRSAVQEIAKELVLLYAKRQEMKGYQFSPDTVWQREFEELFPFEETQDQLHAIEDTKRDMESVKIMDRLICGDVGYGKTEIAIRAAFKAVNDGKQVAFLVPTTILAQQHYNTLIERLGDFPVTVEMLSRFRTPAQQKKAIACLKKGQVDIVVGTHRLLSKDVEFKNLGLLIVDEEQRFGVKHKERLKELKTQVDVLTLTATPIPRTLHMSMLGIRDLSVIETPPTNRYPVQTYVMETNYGVVRDAILREISRGGQVYYVHNRVDSIEQKVSQLEELIPEARIGFIHGQMTEIQLENTLMDFINAEYDVLVTTTIIETGVDIPNANTLFIENADMMGLSQLYQLRGRVGRSSRVSYAYLMYKPEKILSEVSEKRLEAIKGFTELGSGFKIAMRDLSIRGAGNLLGAEQSGFIDSVGFELYSQLLEEAVHKRMGGDKVKAKTNAEIMLGLDAFIPSYYIRDERQKIEIYKRIRQIDSRQSYEELQDEMIDRFGEYPDEVAYLLEIGLLKIFADNALVEKIEKNKTMLILSMAKSANTMYIPQEYFEALAETALKASVGEKSGQMTFQFKIDNRKDVVLLREIMNFTEKLSDLRDKHEKE
ncbi:MAG TPA: transcription-repair coupling factor [Lactococcus sp.]|nr:transcription-repair coupling factor [Lactococcus sp.]